MDAGISKRIKAMTEDYNDLISELEKYDDSILNKKPNPESWSVLQVIHHLMLSEDYALKYVKKKLSFNPKLKNTGLQTQFRVFLWDAYLYAPFKFNAPAAINTENLPETSSLAEIKEKYPVIRQNTTDFFETVSDELLRKEVYKHPFAGRLSLAGMLHFQAGHFKRHRSQINKILKIVS